MKGQGGGQGGGGAGGGITVNFVLILAVNPKLYLISYWRVGHQSKVSGFQQQRDRWSKLLLHQM
jgi:hypothetical protein